MGIEKNAKQLVIKVLRWLEKKLAKYREAPEEKTPQIYLPETEEDLAWLLGKVPKKVLSGRKRNLIAMAMSFDEKTVRSVMMPRKDITFVHENDFLGPLMLDKLYKSGLSHFPVLGKDGGIVGILQTDSLNRLEIKDTERASKYLEPKIHYVGADYGLGEAFSMFLRTDSSFALVVDGTAAVVGLITLRMLIENLVGEISVDDFDQDENAQYVAKRRA